MTRWTWKHEAQSAVRQDKICKTLYQRVNACVTTRKKACLYRELAVFSTVSADAATEPAEGLAVCAASEAENADLAGEGRCPAT